MLSALRDRWCGAWYNIQEYREKERCGLVKELDLSLVKLREKLLRLTYIYGYRRGGFILSSGRSSDYYIDAKQVVMTPEGLHAMAMYIITSLQEQNISADAVGGLTLGADPIAAAVCALSQLSPRYQPLNCFIVRKEGKKHGTASRIEGPFQKKMRVIIVDDVLTTGASVLNAAGAVEEAEARVSAVYVLVDRQEGGCEAALQAGYKLESVISRTDLNQLQQQVQGLYPLLFERLQAGDPPWHNLPWCELESKHRSLQNPLEQIGSQLARAREKGLYNVEPLKKAAQLLLAAVKAAELHPDGETEALRILGRVKTDFGL
jgi:orotate phosphoribosyltransferase